MTFEAWKAISGYEGLYEVSDLGRVRSLDRKVYNQSGPYMLLGKVLKTRLDRDGYSLVTFTVDRVAKTFKVHRLVLGTFEPREDATDFEVDHRNGLRSDNRLRNLRWATIAQNRFETHGPVRSSSGVRGVCHRPEKNKPWQAYRNENGKFKSLGFYATKDEAAAVRAAYVEQRRRA